MATRQSRRMQRRLKENVPIVGGGAVGLGTVVGLRQFVDVQEGATVSIIGSEGSMAARLTRPSTAYGLGLGGLSGILWLADIGPDWIQDAYLGHALTAIPAGAASAAVPVEPEGGNTASATATRQRPVSESRPGSNGQGEFAPTGGRSAETQPAN